MAGEITVDGSGKVTQGGNGTPLDEKTGQAAGAGASAGASESGSAGAGGNDGLYTPDASQGSETSGAEDTTTAGDFTQKSVSKGNADAEAPEKDAGSNVGKKL